MQIRRENRLGLLNVTPKQTQKTSRTLIFWEEHSILAAKTLGLS
ncbi:hypothetical protein [Holospora curviuscula]|nr:hypothetical protein [Holospora curviuscula]